MADAAGLSLDRGWDPYAGPVPDLVSRLRAAGCVFAEEEAGLLTSVASGPDLEAMVVRRLAGEPLEYVLGWVDFDNQRIGLEPGVFIPRQRTAFLVELAAATLDTVPLRVRTHTSARSPAHERAFVGPRARVRGTVVDLCCGSGALGLAVARRRPGVVLHASDSDPTAVACAARNLAAVDAHTYLGDLAEALPTGLRGTVDVLLANVPYVPSAAVEMMPPESREHEPLGTVDGGADGLDVLRRVAAIAPAWLRPGGTVFCEISRGQIAAASAAFASAGLTPTVHRDDEREATVIAGTRS